MVLTCLISYPLSLILDHFLGRDVKTLYDRERLLELIKVTNDEKLLDKNELNIISGTLALKRKTVVEIMTKLDLAFMLPYDSVLDFETLAEISRQGKILRYSTCFATETLTLFGLLTFFIYLFDNFLRRFHKNTNF